MTILNNLNYIDLIIIVFSFCCIIAGIVRGFTNDILGMLNWICSVIITIKLLPIALPYTLKVINHSFIANIITTLGLFFISLFVLSFINGRIGKWIRVSSLSGMNRLLGVLSGSLRAVILLTIFYASVLCVFKPENVPQYINKAQSTKFLKASTKILYRYILKDSGICVASIKNHISQITDIQEIEIVQE